MSKIKSFIIAFFAIVVLILPLTGCTAGNSGQTFTVTFAQDGESDIVRTVRNGERISDVPAPAGGDGETVIEWNFDFDKPVVFKKLTGCKRHVVTHFKVMLERRSPEVEIPVFKS